MTAPLGECRRSHQQEPAALGFARRSAPAAVSSNRAVRPEQQRKANQRGLYFGILVLWVAICGLVFSLMTGIKFH